MIAVGPMAGRRAALGARGHRWATPRGLVVRAAVLVAAHLATRLLGWRVHTGFLSLTASPGLDLSGTTFRGVAYLVLHLSAVLVVPALLFAAAALWSWNRMRRAQDAGTPHSPAPAAGPKVGA